MSSREGFRLSAECSAAIWVGSPDGGMVSEQHLELWEQMAYEPRFLLSNVQRCNKDAALGLRDSVLR